jgi:hypothetical protein
MFPRQDMQTDTHDLAIMHSQFVFLALINQYSGRATNEGKRRLNVRTIEEVQGFMSKFLTEVSSMR